MVDDRQPSVVINNLPTGRIKPRHVSQSEHSYKAVAICREHGGKISSDFATVLRLANNLIRVVNRSVSILVVRLGFNPCCFGFGVEAGTAKEVIR